MKQRSIAGRSIGALGLGCMGMSWAYGGRDDAESRRTLERALELGVNFWDTADLYGAGANEEFLSQVLKTKRDQIALASKFGNVIDHSLTSHQDLVQQEVAWIVDGTPAYVRNCCDLSLKRLGIEVIDLYYQHRVDPRVPIEETVGEMSRLVEQGKIRAVGLSEAGAETIRRAAKVHPIAAVQSEYSLFSRDVEQEILPVCRELNIAFVPYSPIGRGMLTGTIKSLGDLEESDRRRGLPRFAEENFERNMKLVAVVEKLAERKRCTPAQAALAWLLAQGDDIIPIPGTKRVRYLEENVAALEVELDAEDIAALESLVAFGERYPEEHMRLVNG